MITFTLLSVSMNSFISHVKIVIHITSAALFTLLTCEKLVSLKLKTLVCDRNVCALPELQSF